MFNALRGYRSHVQLVFPNGRVKTYPDGETALKAISGRFVICDISEAQTGVEVELAYRRRFTSATPPEV